MTFQNLGCILNNVLILSRMVAQAHVKCEIDRNGEKVILSNKEISVLKTTNLLLNCLKHKIVAVSVLKEFASPFVASSISRTISLLQNNGLVERIFAEPEGEKRRRFCIKFTDEGAKTAKEITEYENREIENLLENALKDELPMTVETVLYATESFEQYLIKRVEEKENNILKNIRDKDDNVDQDDKDEAETEN